MEEFVEVKKASKALIYFCDNIEPLDQWQKAVDLLRSMDHMEKAGVWGLMINPNISNAQLSVRRTAYKRALKEAEGVGTSQSSGPLLEKGGFDMEYVKDLLDSHIMNKIASGVDPNVYENTNSDDLEGILAQMTALTAAMGVLKGNMDGAIGIKEKVDGEIAGLKGRIGEIEKVSYVSKTDMDAALGAVRGSTNTRMLEVESTIGSMAERIDETKAAVQVRMIQSTLKDESTKAQFKLLNESNEALGAKADGLKLEVDGWKAESTENHTSIMELVAGFKEGIDKMESKLAIEEAARIAGDETNRLALEKEETARIAGDEVNKLALEKEAVQLRALIAAQDTSISANTFRMQQQFEDFKNTAVQPGEGAAASTLIQPSGAAAAVGWAVRPTVNPPAAGRGRGAVTRGDIAPIEDHTREDSEKLKGAKSKLDTGRGGSRPNRMAVVDSSASKTAELLVPAAAGGAKASSMEAAEGLSTGSSRGRSASPPRRDAPTYWRNTSPSPPETNQPRIPDPVPNPNRSEYTPDDPDQPIPTAGFSRPSTMLEYLSRQFGT